MSGLNGQWLNGTLKTQQGWVTANGTAGAPATLFMFDKEGTPIADFRAGIGWIAGTDDDFVGQMSIDKPRQPYFGFVHVKDGKFQSINGYGAYSDVNGFTTYDFTFNGKILKKVSPDLEAVGCATYTP